MKVAFQYLCVCILPALSLIPSVSANTPGQVDPSWSVTNPALNASPTQIIPRADGSLWVSGVGPGLYKINADGVHDIGWNIGTGATGGTVLAVAELSNGQVMIAGGFTAVNGHGSRRLARLNANGSVDNSFTVGTSINGNIGAIHVQGDGRILIGGSFTTIGGVSRNGIARLNADGTLDSSFDPGTGAMGAVAAGSISHIVPMPGGTFVIGGLFNNYNGSGKGSLVRIHSDGSYDTSWALNNMFMSTPNRILRMPDGGMMLAYNGDAKMVRRLYPDGSVDDTFDTGFINGAVYGMALQADGKVVIAGAFTSINGTSRTRLARLNADGSLDTGYFSAGGPNAQVNVVAQAADGNIHIGGNFATVQSLDRARIAKIFGEAPAVVSVDRETVSMPEGIVLLGNWPNPFNPTTVIGFRLSVSSDTRLAVHDVLGREVAVLVDGQLPSGNHQIRFDATGLPSGTYLVRLEAGSQVLTRRMTLLK